MREDWAAKPGTIPRMEERTPSDEISLRDLYLVLRQWRWLVLALPLGAAALTFIVCQFLPRYYESRGVFSLSVVTDKLASPLNNLPSLTGLVQGYNDALSSTFLTKELAEPEPWEVFKTRFDDKRGIWTLTSTGSTPEQARERVERLMRSTRGYLEDRLVSTIKTNIQGTLEQAQLDLDLAERSLKRLDMVLSSTPRFTSRDAGTTAGLEAQGVGPQSSRSSDPAFVSLSLQQTSLRAQRAHAQARIDTFNSLLGSAARLKAFAGQALAIQTLTVPSAPIRPESPRPLLFTAVAGVLGLLLGLVLPFVFEAIRDPVRPRAVNHSEPLVQVD